MTPKTIGFPRMHKEAGERRDFLPELMEFVDRVGARDIVIEEGYGSGMGLSPDDYRAASSKVRVGSYEECLGQDLVVVLRCPDEDALRKIRRGAVVYSMFHYPTRPARVQLLVDLGLRAVSLDGLTDDRGRRLVENLASVGWNGVKMAFRELAKTYRRYDQPGRRPLRVMIIGSGAVGGNAAHAATRYGDPALRSEMVAQGVPGVEVKVIDYDLTGLENYMLDQLERTDMLVDATQRPDASRPVIPNAWLAALPQHAVMLDLSVDPYDFSVDPPVVKGIEGVPEGNLDQFVFPPEHPAWDKAPPPVKRDNRRVALSCYSWPGVDPRACMEIYGMQIQPVLRIALEQEPDDWDLEKGRYFERAVARAEITRWRKVHPIERRSVRRGGESMG